MLRGLGVSVVEIAHRLGASIRSVHRWISEIRCVPSPSAPSDFERPRRPKNPEIASVVLSDELDEVKLETPHAASARSEASTEASTESSVRYERNNEQHADDLGKGVRGKTIGGPMAYIRRRIAEIVSRGGDDRPP